MCFCPRPVFYLSYPTLYFRGRPPHPASLGLALVCDEVQRRIDFNSISSRPLPCPPSAGRHIPPNAMAGFQGGASSRKRKNPTEQVVPDVDNAGGASTSPTLPGLSRRVLSDGASSHLGLAADSDPDYPIPNFDYVYARMRDPSSGFQVVDRRWRLLSYSKCFVGSEAVSWMVEILGLTRPDAVRTGQHLMDAGIIHHVTHSEPFSDNYYFFRFQEDDESSILNMKRVWDPALPARNAVQVAQELLTRLACLCEEYRLRIIAAPPTPVLTAPNFAAPAEEVASVAASSVMQPQPRGPLGIGPPITPRVSLSSQPDSAPHTPVLTDPFARMTSTAALQGGLGARRAEAGISPTILCGAADDVDYSLLAKSEEFRLYTLAAAELQGVQLLALSHDEKIAFFGNMYNALCLHCYIVQSAPTNVIRRWVFFRTLAYRIAGLDMSLDDIEHGILRGNKRAPMIKIVQQLRPSDPKCQHVLTKRDGRIHFVISAGTGSDPPIRILDGDSIQEQLHDAAVEFLSHAVKIDVAARTVTLPRIFYWYADDFPSPDLALLKWVGQFLLAEPAHALSMLLAGDDSSPPTVNYENFQWCVSDTRFIAAVVRRKRRRLERERAAATANAPSSAGVGGASSALQHFGSLGANGSCDGFPSMPGFGTTSREPPRWPETVATTNTPQIDFGARPLSFHEDPPRDADQMQAQTSSAQPLSVAEQTSATSPPHCGLRSPSSHAE